LSAQLIEFPKITPGKWSKDECQAIARVVDRLLKEIDQYRKELEKRKP